MKNSPKRYTRRKPFVLGKHFRSSDTGCWDKWDQLVLNLSLLLGKTQYRSDITSEIRILLYFGYYFKISDSIGKTIGGYVLRKANIRCELKMFSSLIVPKIEKEGRSGILQHPFCSKYREFVGRVLGDIDVPYRTIKISEKKVSQSQKKGKISVRNPSALH